MVSEKLKISENFVPKIIVKKQIPTEFSVPLDYEIDRPPAFDPPRIECHLDQIHFIRHMAYIGNLHHEQILEEAPEIWLKIPDLGVYDNLLDMRFHTGNVDWDTVKEIGKKWKLHFSENPPHNRTAFVSRQAAFTILIRAVQAFAPLHTFQAFTSKEQAVAWLRKGP